MSENAGLGPRIGNNDPNIRTTNLIKNSPNSLPRNQNQNLFDALKIKKQFLKNVEHPDWSNNGQKKGMKSFEQEERNFAAVVGNIKVTVNHQDSASSEDSVSIHDGGGFGSGGYEGDSFRGRVTTRQCDEGPTSFPVSHVTKELNCKVVMHPTFCILQDTRTGVIIGRGTERQGLYFVDEVTQHGTVMLAHGTTTREAWLWHRRLGHPSIGYMHLLFPKLFSSNKPLNCETCVLAKSHRHTYKPNNTRVNVPFSLIHSDVWGPAEVIGGQNFRFFVLLMIALV
ncbi:hypothetical protein QVD17_27299 [Tagetes erecta]|uniref:GAG-pre-integrase domain-containing protein n=1 Tax=Tagetes erecta TaxID=13708 RepID=A0AAD8K866_TARER|nr:hypothetical protein QVD17_27299 [Tagetes erecta]